MAASAAQVNNLVSMLDGYAEKGGTGLRRITKIPIGSLEVTPKS